MASKVVARFCVVFLLFLAGAAQADVAETTVRKNKPYSGRLGRLLHRSEEQNQKDVSFHSPRATVGRFLEASRKGLWSEAASYLDVPASLEADQEGLARRLKEVFDRRVTLEVSLLSGESQGNLDDDLAASVEQIASFYDGGEEAVVRLVRRSTPRGQEWVFSQKTVEQIDEWHSSLKQPGVLRYVPESLQKTGPLDLRWWQWISLPLVLLVGWGLGGLLGLGTRRFLHRLVLRTEARWDDEILAKTQGLIRVIWALVVIYLLLSALALPASVDRFFAQVFSSSVLLVFFWGLVRSANIIVAHIVQSDWGKNRPASKTIVPLLGKVLVVLIIAIGVIAVLSDLGYPVGSLIAGLGIGGLALALAAQKTVENLFGAFSIGVDQPMQVGDYISIDSSLAGTVEEIGMRSTKIRSLDRTVITIPNGRLAEMSIESLTARDRFRLATTVSLRYTTSLEDLQHILSGFRTLLVNHPKIWKDNIIVYLKEFAPSSLDIDVAAWFLAADTNEFRAIREEVLLGFLDVVERAGTSLALPLQEIHVAKGDPVEAFPFQHDISKSNGETTP